LHQSHTRRGGVSDGSASEGHFRGKERVPAEPGSVPRAPHAYGSDHPEGIGRAALRAGALLSGTDLVFLARLFFQKNQVDLAEQRSNPSRYNPDSFYRMRCVRMRCAWHEGSPGQGPISSPKRRPHVRPVGRPSSAGVGPVQKWSVPPGRPRWSPKKGNNFGQQKSTLTEIIDRIPKKPSRFGSENSLWVDFLGPVFFPFAEHAWRNTGAQDRFG
jgi:hypothetical protein